VKIRREAIRLEQHFDLDLTIDSWIYPDIQPVPEIKSPGRFARCISLDSYIVPIQIKQKLEKSELFIEWAAYPGVRKVDVIRNVTWLLGLDVDTRAALHAIQEDPVISHLAQPLAGLRPYSLLSFFEALIKAVLQQQVSYRSASQVTRNLVVQYGDRCKFGDQIFFNFPLLETLAKLAEEELRRCKVGYKAPYILEICKKASNHELDFEEMSQQDTGVLLARLDELRGVGPWTAELTVLTAQRDLTVFPCDDLGIRKLISELYLEGKKANRRDVEEVAKRWGSQSSLVLYFLMGAQVLGMV
jgi:DNA-3-methyladenine glycosylase II